MQDSRVLTANFLSLRTSFQYMSYRNWLCCHGHSTITCFRAVRLDMPELRRSSMIFNFIKLAFPLNDLWYN